MREPLQIPEIVLRRGASAPLHRQIREQVTAAIRNGVLRGGSRLPATRVLASLLGVSRNTVLAAYDELVAAGMIEGQPGSGMRVLGGSTAPHFDLSQLMRAAQYPARLVYFEDPDGNSLAVNF